ncbi:MAG: alkaline phosphatase D family protein [Gemmatimonadota bacterium]|nr:alkaline phosphatase D family protein [Gemmatimonadota bacterium]
MKENPVEKTNDTGGNLQAGGPVDGDVHGPDSVVFKSDRPWPNARLRVGAIIGHTTPRSVRMWFRTGSPGNFTAILYDCAEAVESSSVRRTLRARLGRVPLSAEETGAVLSASRVVAFTLSDYNRDTTHVLDVDELEPDRRYGYVLHSDADGGKVVLGHNRLRSFRTPPAREERRPFQIAMFSCHMPYDVSGMFKKRTHVGSIDTWDFLGATLRRHAANVDVVIAGGDQSYCDGVETLNIWKLLNRTMRREGGRLLPDEASMRSWYRDIYRGYWGFDGVQRVFDSYPTYMIWDDHEICDGWGSHYLSDGGPHDGLTHILPDLEERGLTRDDGRELVKRMVRAACRVYHEYQHSHNPPTADGVWDYSFDRGGAAFYVLDGRGQRNIERQSHRTLGADQFRRFEAWADGLDPAETPFMFVVSAVPVLHAKSALVAADLSFPFRQAGLGDDLRDSWEHQLHDEERVAMMEVLFRAAGRGVRPCILSGDVHVSAVFSIDDNRDRRIWQLTSSAITYHISRPLGWALRLGAADDGVTDDGYRFRRLALYTGSSYALISVDPRTQEAWFKLYGKQMVEAPTGQPGTEVVPLSHSVGKIRLF